MDQDRFSEDFRATAADAERLMRAAEDVADRALWEAALTGGKPAVVEAMLKDGFTPLTETNDGHMPLTALCAVTPEDEGHAAGLVQTARVLIRSGAPLNAPDHRGLFPADAALVSAAPALCREVVEATLHERKQSRSPFPFRPNMNALFCLVVREDERQRLHERLSDNLDMLRAAFAEERRNAPSSLHSLGADEKAFWHSLATPALEALPTPSEALKRQFQLIASYQFKADNQAAAAERFGKRLGYLKAVYREQERQDARIHKP